MKKSLIMTIALLLFAPVFVSAAGQQKAVVTITCVVLEKPTPKIAYTLQNSGALISAPTETTQRVVIKSIEY